MCDKLSPKDHTQVLLLKNSLVKPLCSELELFVIDITLGFVKPINDALPTHRVFLIVA